MSLQPTTQYRKIAAARSGRAVFLAAAGLLGLVVAPQPRAPRQQDGHGHSHGPSSPGPHGSGAPAHLGIALHAAPRLIDLPAIAPEHAAPVAFVGQLCNALPYLVPEWSQGPPAGS